MHTTPFTFQLPATGGIPSEYDSHTVRRLSSMPNMYLDADAYAAQITADPVLYEVYEIHRPHNSGELLHGVTVLHPGKIGAEYHMTKGHFHDVLETGEVYYCLSGQGMLVMETPEGDTSVLPFNAGTVLYVLPRWAHRTVNISATEPLIFFFVYPGHAGHNYGTIEQQGFRKLVVEMQGQPTVVDNPRWGG
ncbi:MAG: glucose-6-phosphate isomerase [Anaerolineae bacterium]|nr:glucose-6-phosphate isomerase [Chloroflexota bacterium]MBN8633736.1 glucose-6-phosphate isomerase [Anaerolineae bacterium]